MKKKIFALMILSFILAFFCNTIGTETVLAAATEKTPAAPKLVSVKGKGTDQIVVTWKAVSNVTGYRVYRRVYGEKKWGAIKTLSGAKTTSYVDTTVKMGVVYEYTVRGYKKSGSKTTWGLYDQAGMMGNSAVNMPEIKWPTSTNTYIKIRWNKVKDVTGYKVYRKEVNGKWNLLNGNCLETKYFDKNFVPTKQYYYGVRAYVLTNGKEVLSPLDYWKQPEVAPLPPVKGFKAETAGSGSEGVYIKISWKPADYVGSYTIIREERKNTLDNKYTNPVYFRDIKGNLSSYIDKTAVLGKHYKYTIYSRKKVNKKEYTSAKVAVEIDARIQVPKITSIVEGEDGISIAWEPVAGAKRYKIVRRQDGYTSVTLGTVSANSQLVFKDTSEYEEGAIYYYTAIPVVQYLTENKSGRENNLGKIQTRIYYPEVPRLVAAVPKSTTSIFLDWEPVDTATTYYIYRKEMGKLSWEKIATINSGSSDFSNTEYTDYRLKEEQTYYYTVSGMKRVPVGYAEGPYDQNGISVTTYRGNLELSETELPMCIGQNVTLELKGTSRTVEWISMNPLIATVSKGKIKALAVGTTEIIAEFEGEQYICEVTVEDPRMSVSKLELEVGESAVISMTGTNQTIKWDKSNSDCAIEKISSNEVRITPLKAGVFSVGASVVYGEYEKHVYCMVTVNGQLSVSKRSVSLKLGHSVNLTINCNYRDLTVETANKNIVETKLVNHRDNTYTLKLRGIKIGETKIKIFTNNPKLERTITVKVVDSDSVLSSNLKLKNYILKHGERGTDGNMSIYDGGVIGDYIHIWTITYVGSDNNFVYGLSIFSADEDVIRDEMVLAMDVNIRKSKSVLVEFLWAYEPDNAYGLYKGTLTSNTYNKQDITFKKAESQNMTSSELKTVKGLSNDILQLGFEGWEKLLLKEKVGISIKNLGFNSYVAPK